MNSEKIITIYVNLLEEGSPVMRPTQAIDLGNGLFKLLPTDDYNPECEIWEFLPGTVVQSKQVASAYGGYVTLAIKG